MSGSKIGQTFLISLFGLCWAMALGGCGESISAAPAGVYIDSTTEQFLIKAFEETKACTGLEGQFEGLSVVLMPPTFPCKHYPNGCSGEYVEPNSLKVGSLYIFRHEVIHYLLNVNTGDPDATHKSSLFTTCS